MTVDAKMVRGDTISLDLVAEVGGAPINLTAMLVRFTAKHDPADAEAVMEKSSEDGGVTVMDAAAGRIRVNIESVDTSGLPPRPLWLHFDVEVSDAAGHRFTATMGVLELRPDVSS